MYATRALSILVLTSTILAGTAGCGRSDDAKPAPTASTANPTGTPSATTSPTQTPSILPFKAVIGPVNREMLRYSWRKGCPVGLDGLRHITMTYWGFDGRPHEDGRMVVNAKVAQKIADTFKKLYDQRFPIRRMELVDNYKGDDFDSIEADNTSAFNCRPATGSSSWSRHAYGMAVDINPGENPYVEPGGRIYHEKFAKFYKRRNAKDKGVIVAGDKVVKAFEAMGWKWGGYWSGTKDYQHFSDSR